MSVHNRPSFAIECACGVWARGERQSKPQVLTCAGCGKPLFVFPATASVFGSAGIAAAPPWQLPMNFWLPPAVAAVLALAVVGLVITAIVRSRDPADSRGPEISEARATINLNDRMAAARAALEDGSYHVAREELNAANDLLLHHPRALPPDDARTLVRWQRQAALLADLLPESIAEIVTHSVGRADKEWNAIFQERYAGKALLLDARVVRASGGKYQIDYHLEAAGSVGEWEFDGLRLFDGLPLQQPQRLFFGFRLRAIKRLSRDQWTVVPEPDSGVLVTDPIMLNGLSLPGDDGLTEVMRRQSKWAED